MKKLLMVDEDRGLLQRAERELRRYGWETFFACDGEDARRLLEDHALFDIVLVEVLDEAGSPGWNGIEILKQSQAREPSTPILVMAPPERLDRVLLALKLGALDYLQKPFPVEVLPVKLLHALEYGRMLRSARSQHVRIDPFAVEEPGGWPGVLHETIDALPAIAASNAPLLVLGELGTAKPFVAEFVHARSPRASGAFVPVICLPDDPGLEGRVFGYEPGLAANGNGDRVAGLIDLAHGGTLFLDEVGNLDPQMQARILRVLEEDVFVRTGGSRCLGIDVRIIAATNRNLEERVAQGTFREDLYHRLNVLRVGVPPLRERPDAVISIGQRIMERFAGHLGKSVKGFTPAALHALHAYSWPGNVRELQHIIERAVLLAKSEEIDDGDLDLVPGDQASLLRRRSWQPVSASPAIGLDSIEKQAILQALRLHDWVQKDAARFLKISPRVMNYKIHKYEITNERWRTNKTASTQS